MRRKEEIQHSHIAPLHLQDVCALARAYGSCTQARETLSYEHMAALWHANNATRLIRSYPRTCSPETHIQAVIQACFLVVERPELVDAAPSCFIAIRAAGIYLTALTLASQPPHLNIRARLNSSTYKALCEITTPECLCAVVRVLLAGAEHIAFDAPRHGSAYAPVNPHVTPIPRDTMGPRNKLCRVTVPNSEQ